MVLISCSRSFFLADPSVLSAYLLEVVVLDILMKYTVCNPVSTDPQTTLHNQIRKVSLRNGRLPSLYTADRGEDNRVKCHCWIRRFKDTQILKNPRRKVEGRSFEDFLGAIMITITYLSICILSDCTVWVMFNNLYIYTFQLYDACKGKTSEHVALADFSITNRITVDFWAFKQ